METKHKRIGLYGGAFDPIHFAHLKVIEAALDLGNLDELWVIPSWHHSFVKKMAPFEDRMWMARLAVCYVRHDQKDRVHVKNIEQEMKTVYTIDLVEHLVKTEPDNTWVLIIGPDILENTNKWKRWDDLTKLVEILLVPEQSDTRSTKIRELAAIGDYDGMRGMVPVPILHCIRGRSLYKC